MIKREINMENVYKEKLREGSGTAHIRHIFEEKELNGKCRLFAKVTLEPGSSIGNHRHDGEEEIYYVLDGQGTVNDNGQVKEIYSGDAVLTGHGQEHSIENTGDQELVFLAVILIYV